MWLRLDENIFQPHYDLMLTSIGWTLFLQKWHILKIRPEDEISHEKFWLLEKEHYVTYWPLTQLSIEKQVHPVEDITLTCGRVEFGADATPTRSRWASNNYITRCHRQFELVGVSCSWSSSCSSRQWEPAPNRGRGLQDPRLSSPAKWERSAAKIGGTGCQYVCSVSNSPLTHNPFATLLRIKCERYIFQKKCVRSLLLIMFPHVYV